MYTRLLWEETLQCYVSSKVCNQFKIQGVTGPHRQNDRDDRSCREDHFFWRNIYSQTCRLWVMRRWRCSPVRVGIDYKKLYTYHFIEKGMFLQYVFKQSALCLIACLISSQQRSANTSEQQVLLVQSTVVVAPKEKTQGSLNEALHIATTEWRLTAQIIISSAYINPLPLQLISTSLLLRDQFHSRHLNFTAIFVDFKWTLAYVSCF